ncbi:dynamin family protein [Bacillus sp. S/N-304-OC-R1]|uniref:dynamin family protein n=1 Tax=Bacillus sp. S/N-304-OC-R1 TaxID=2758034 RepID=UPI001C8EDAA0|nr:dynamin family protein [Bacillus sp. S/N-304-OC-R1]MBY0124393.1 dynamin family protein [Bacillus sp. S/N-304-OC-R1]
MIATEYSGQKQKFESVKEYYKALCSFSYENHPTYIETPLIKTNFFELLFHFINSDKYFKTYQQTVKSTYEVLFKGYDSKKAADLINIKSLLHDTRKLRVQFKKFGIRFYSYKYIFLAHYLILRYGNVEENDQEVQQIINKINLKVNINYASKIIKFTNALKSCDFKLAKELLHQRPCKALTFLYDEFKKYDQYLIEGEENFLVIGTMSSGKSTFLNCLVGRDLFPSQNEACTAKVFTYTNVPSKDRFFISTNNEQTFQCSFSLEESDLKLLNENLDTKRIDIEGALSPLYKTNKKIRLIDTPGTNNSMDRSHQQVTYQSLLNEHYDTVLYVINATQLGTDDDKVLLKHAKETIAKRQKDIVFIVNKVDEIDEEGQESIEGLVNNTIDYLTGNGFENPKILFSSAFAAKLGQNIILDQPITRREKKHFDFYYDYFSQEAANLSQYATLKLKQTEFNKVHKSTSIQNYETNKIYNVVQNSGVFQITNLF